jgi:hypothetical protein
MNPEAIVVTVHRFFEKNGHFGAAAEANIR